MFCEKCGNQMPDDSKFCLSCGAPTVGNEAAQEATQEAATSIDTATDAVMDTAAEVNSAAEQPAAPAQPAPQPAPQAVPQSTPIWSATPQASQTAPQQAPAQPMQNQYYQQPAAPEKPEKVAPLKTWKFIGMFILAGIPLLGFIMILVWNFSSSFNKNTKSFARAILILWIIGLILSIISIIINWALIQSLIDFINSEISITY